jgi:hypothetical protein
MREIPLYGKFARGRVALVDDEDYDHLIKYRWRASATEYVTGKIDGKSVNMHVFILGHSDYFHIHHINHNRLDNRKVNLVQLTPQEHMREHRMGHGKGYCYSTKHKKWLVRCSRNGRNVFGGYFNTEEEAKLASARLIDGFKPKRERHRNYYLNSQTKKWHVVIRHDCHLVYIGSYDIEWKAKETADSLWL